MREVGPYRLLGKTTERAGPAGPSRNGGIAPVVALGLAVAATGCSDAERGIRAAATIRDSAGIQVVESVRPSLPVAEAWRVGVEPLLAIGVLDGAPAYEFSEVAGAVRLPDSSVAVADAVAQEVRFFDGDGRHVRSAGGPGEGPGEFSGLGGIGLHPDGGVWAWDFQLRRITRLGPRGVRRGVVRVGPEPLALHPMGMLPDGSLVLRQLWGVRRTAEASETGVRRDSVAFVRFDSTGALVDTIGLFPGREIYIDEEGGRGVMLSLPFGRNAVGTVRGERVVVGTQERFEIRQLAPDGTLLRIARIPSRNVSLSTGEAARILEERVREAPAEERSALRRRLESLPVPDRKPAHGAVLADAVGNLWVAEWAPWPHLPSRWTVLDTDGRWLTEVGFPQGFYPLQVGDDWVLGLHRDELDVEKVELRPLVKPGI